MLTGPNVILVLKVAAAGGTALLLTSPPVLWGGEERPSPPPLPLLPCSPAPPPAAPFRGSPAHPPPPPATHPAGVHPARTIGAARGEGEASSHRVAQRTARGRIALGRGQAARWFAAGPGVEITELARASVMGAAQPVGVLAAASARHGRQAQ